MTQNDTPFPRVDYKAKKHGKPKPKVHYRRSLPREAVARELGVGL